MVCLLPLAAGLVYSFLYSIELIGRLSAGLRVETWRQLIYMETGWNSLLYTGYLAMLSLLFSILLAFIISWGHFKQVIYKHWIGLLFIPLAFPPLVVGVAWYSLLEPAGLLSRLIFHVGLIKQVSDFPVIVQDYLGIGMMISNIYLITPVLSLWFIRQTQMLKIAELYFTSLTLGSSELNFFLKVYIPYLFKVNSGLIILYGIFMLGIYEAALLLGSNTTRVMTIFILDYLTLFDLNMIPLGHAWLFLFVFMLLMIALFSYRVYLRQIR